MSQEDSQALASSEVFQNYVKITQANQEVSLEKISECLAALEAQIKNSPKLTQSFRQLQNQIITEGSEIAPEIADAVLLLDLDF